MANTEETREFFLREAPLNAGDKRDRETGFPTKYLVDGILRFNRFLKDHVPSENVFTKLFKSITFKLNVEDTAGTSTQGLVKTASDADVIAKTVFTDGYSRAVQPYQIPDVVLDDTSSGGTYTLTAGTTSLGGGKSRKKYTLKIVVADPPNKYILLSNNLQVTNCGTSGGTETMKSYSLTANTLGTNSNYLEVEGVFKVITNAGALAEFGLYLGSTLLINYRTTGASEIVYLKARINRISSSTQLCVSEGYAGSTLLSTKTNIGKVVSGTEDLTTTLTIAAKLTSSVDTPPSAGDMQCLNLIVKHIKA